MTRVHALVLVAALALVAVACGGGSGSDPTTTTMAATTIAAPSATTQATAATTTTAGGTGTTGTTGGSQEITILAEGGVYVPDTLTVSAGELEVTFTDNDIGSDEPHNIHFQIGDSHYFTPINDSAPTTETVTFTVDEPGEYQFWCDTHPDTLKGVLTVEG
jgi:plastocyanin